MPTDDSSGPHGHGTLQMPDAHGQAALLLVESLIHGLIARSIITTDDAIDIVDSANSVQFEVAEEADGAGAPMWRAHALLSAIEDSLRIDGDGTSASKESPDGMT